MLRTIALVVLLQTAILAADQPRFRVLLYNYSTAPAEMVSEMQARVAALFAESGLALEWLDCVERLHPACSQELSPRVLVLRLLAAADPARNSPQALGTSYGTAYASIFYDRVRAVARGGVSEPELLACVAAHEIAHLLLGEHSHSRSGLMRAAWHTSDLRCSTGTGFRLSPAERERMRRGALARMAR